MHTTNQTGMRYWIHDLMENVVLKFRTMATLAYNYVCKNPRKRPAMRGISQSLERLQKTNQNIEHLSQAFSFAGEGNSEVVEKIELQIGKLNKLDSISEKHEV